MFIFLKNEHLLNPNQSGFRTSDSCINQLLSITHEIFQSFHATHAFHATKNYQANFIN